MSSPASQPAFDEVEQLFTQALEVRTEEREAFVAARATSPSVAARVMRLLDAHTRSEQVLPTPAEAGPTLEPEDFLDPYIGREIGPYRIESLIGSGGMGAVYLAQQVSPRRQVAIKVLHLVAAAQGSVSRFRQEAEILGFLDHPGIAKVFHAGMVSLDAARVPYLAMEYIDGRTLLADITQRQPTLEQKLRLFISICEAVEYAHRKGVIHRDLKPSNIMVTGDGQPRILDFGVARLTRRDADLTLNATSPGQLVGTLAYMSPEQAMGDAANIDTRSDVYSLGVILYEMLAAKRPYEIDSGSVALAATTIRTKSPIPLRSFSPQCAGDVETIVLKALAKSVEDRYQSAGDLADDIGRFLKQLPIAARPFSRAYAARKFVARNKGLSLLGVLLLFAILLGITGTTLAWRRSIAAEALARQHESEAAFNAYIGNLAAAQAAIRAFDTRPARAALDRCPEPLRGWEWRYLREQLSDTVTLHEVTPPSSDPFVMSGEFVADIALSGDGKSMVASFDHFVTVFRLPDMAITLNFAPGPLEAGGSQPLIHGVGINGDGTLVAMAHAGSNVASVWSVADGSRVAVLAGHAGPVEDVKFSPDGVLLATSSNDGTVGLWRATDGGSLGRLRGHNGPVQWVQFDASGARMLSIGADRQLIVWDMTTRSIVAKIPCAVDFGPAAISPDGARVAFMHGPNSPVVWDIEQARVICVMDGYESQPQSIVWSPDGRLLATGSNAQTIRVHQASSGAILKTIRGHGDRVTSLRFGPGSDRLFSGEGGRTTIFEWTDLERRRGETPVHPGDFHQMVVSPDGRWLASTGSRWSMAQIQDASTGELVATLDLNANARSLAFTPDGESLLIPGDDGRLYTWSAKDWTLRSVRDGGRPGQQSWSVGVRAGDGLVVSNPFDPQFLSPLEFFPVGEFRRPDLPEEGWFAVASDASLAFRREPEGAIGAYDPVSGARRWISKPGVWTEDSLFFRVEPGSLAVSSASRLSLIDQRSGEVVIRLDGEFSASTLKSVARTPDGSRLFVGYSRGEIDVWDTHVRMKVLSLRFSGWIETLAFVPQTHVLVAGNSAGHSAMFSPVEQSVLGARFARAAALRDRARGEITGLLSRGLTREELPRWMDANAPDPDLAEAMWAEIRTWRSTTEGITEWCRNILTDRTSPADLQLNAARAIYAHNRWRERTTELSALSSLYSLRRSQGTQDSAVLERAAETIQMARRGSSAPQRTRQLVLLVEALVHQQARDREGVTKTLAELDQLGPIEDPALIRLRAELLVPPPEPSE